MAEIAFSKILYLDKTRITDQDKCRSVPIIRVAIADGQVLTGRLSLVGVIRQVLTTFSLAMLLLAMASNSYGNIIVFPGVPNQPQLFEINGSALIFQRLVTVPETSPKVCLQIVPTPVEPPPSPRFYRWLASCQGRGSAETFQPTGGNAQASIPDQYKFFLARPLCWACCGKKVILPPAPIENALKVPIC